jgi:hypothetical protein
MATPAGLCGVWLLCLAGALVLAVPRPQAAPAP